MVKIAIAGGSGYVGREIIDVLVATNKHEILLLSRGDAPTDLLIEAVTWIKVDYNDVKHLVAVLEGVHTVLSFVDEKKYPSAPVHINLIDASIQAGVKRFAPSQWATSATKYMNWYEYKLAAHRYLETVNKDKKVLEYCLFQCGLFTNYFTRPYKSCKHVHLMELQIDFNGHKALLLEGGDEDRITLTTVQDLANVVARAIDYDGEWPIVGGIRGTNISIGELIALGEKLRGSPFTIELLNAEDIKTGNWNATWLPHLDHPSLSQEEVEAFSRAGVGLFLLEINHGGFEITDEWNRLLPDYKFTQAEDFLTEIWKDKP